MRHSGQALVVFAILLPFLVIVLFGAIDTSSRQLQRAALEDALQAATRSALEQYAYDAFGSGTASITDAAAVSTAARRFLEVNLANVKDLRQTPAQVAQSVQWTLLPNGGQCPSARPDRPRPPVTTSPTLCGVATIPLFGRWQTRAWDSRVDAVVSLDAFDF